MTSGLAKKMPLRSGEFGRILRPDTLKWEVGTVQRHSLCILFCAEVKCRPRSDSLLQFGITNILQIRTEK